MSELLPFSLRYECFKCGGMRFDYRYRPPITMDEYDRTIREEHLQLQCQTCDFTMYMMTKDAEVARVRK